MNTGSIRQVFRGFRRLNIIQWTKIGLVGAGWLSLQLILAGPISLATADSMPSAWASYLRPGLSAMAVALVTLVTLQKPASMLKERPSTASQLLAAIPLLVVGLVAIRWGVPALYNIASSSPFAPSVLALAALATPALMFGLIGPSLPAAMDGPRPPWSAIRLGFALTQGMRWKLTLMIVIWFCVNFALSTLIFWATSEPYRLFASAARDLLVLPVAVFLTVFYVERTSDTAEQMSMSAVFD
jgi:hypothetical protein